MEDSPNPEIDLQSVSRPDVPTESTSAPSKTLSENDPMRFEFDLLLEEYRIINNRAIRELEADEKGFEFNLVGISAVVIASSFVIDLTAYALLLVMALPFYILVWMQVRRAIVAHRIVNYITEVIAPRLNMIVQNAAIDSKNYGEPLQFKSWEDYVSQQWRNPWVYFAGAISHAGKSGLQLSVSIILLVGYFLLRDSNQNYIPTIFDAFLLILNFLAILVTLVVLTISVSVSLGKLK